MTCYDYDDRKADGEYYYYYYFDTMILFWNILPAKDFLSPVRLDYY